MKRSLTIVILVFGLFGVLWQVSQRGEIATLTAQESKVPEETSVSTKPRIWHDLEAELRWISTLNELDTKVASRKEQQGKTDKDVPDAVRRVIVFRWQNGLIGGWIKFDDVPDGKQLVIAPVVKAKPGEPTSGVIAVSLLPSAAPDGELVKDADQYQWFDVDARVKTNWGDIVDDADELKSVTSFHVGKVRFKVGSPRERTVTKDEGHWGEKRVESQEIVVEGGEENVVRIRGNVVDFLKWTPNAEVPWMSLKLVERPHAK